MINSFKKQKSKERRNVPPRFLTLTVGVTLTVGAGALGHSFFGLSTLCGRPWQHGL